MTKIELIGEILKVCDEKEKLEIDNKILREKIDEYESARDLPKSEESKDNLAIKTKLMFANSLIDYEVRGLHKSITESGSLSHNGNGSVLQDYSTYYPDYKKGMSFREWMSEVEWDSVNAYTPVGDILKKSFSLNDIKQLYLEAYYEVFKFIKKETEEAEKEETEEEDDNDNAE